MKIKVILTETIKGIGKKDEIIEVKDGYANNFLLNKNKAVLATPENINKLQKKNEKIEKNHARDVKEANELKNILAKKEVVLKVKAGENGKVFGSIGAKEIAEAIKEQLNIEIDKKKISSNTRVKDLGLHIVELKLHSEVKGSIKVKVEAK
ncbi:50S ribosomal protein L9 [Leptotrichia sp. oral taxon 498]|jgi:ribosomal protein L9|uniref:50S ribosomal protein L9 n=1 Tax=Leptotrichia sp. oral taxon 498 TaxID=712368 RepID=UPI000B8CB785|nr:50S ribosomal protein L9 [Leptotrichia sp. oral taxon 498]ASQ47604.1 50S ribosomal protein L9 [Leptotrichia sp. oral taxon 498]